MKIDRLAKITLLASTAFCIFILTGRTASAQSVQGVINGRSGATMTLQTADAPKLVVLLTATTEVDEVEGIFHGRKKAMAMTALIP